MSGRKAGCSSQKLTLPFPLTLWLLRPQLSHIVEFPPKSPKTVLLAAPLISARLVLLLGLQSHGLAMETPRGQWDFLGSPAPFPSLAELSFLGRCLHFAASFHTWLVMPRLWWIRECASGSFIAGDFGCLHLNIPVFGVPDAFLVRNEWFIPGTASAPDAPSSSWVPQLCPHPIYRVQGTKLCA